MPEGMRRSFRTSNHIERLNRELKRRSKSIGIFPNDASLVRLIGSVLLEQNSICQAGSPSSVRRHTATFLYQM
ncbi:MAG: transposase [Hornefia butyriciproducens]|nr:transposase [Hornefia butyriciproducens]MDY6211275.1 transposase [Hornefia butyriciproducens]